jgi:uncharacterized protein involved in response to NO
MSLLTIEEPHVPGKENSAFSHHPLFRLGFRPFYLLAAVFAAISIPLWTARYFGLAGGLTHLDLNWHMHEMVFGFAIAVIIGFLYTAGRNWTGLWTPRRGHLAALAGLWIAGRVAMLTAPALLAALVDLLFLPLAAWPMYRVLKRTGNKRNMFLVGLLGLLTVLNLLFHSAVLGWPALPSTLPIQAAILVVVVIEAVIGGRVIPGFTANAVQGVKPVVNEKRDRIGLALTVLAGIAWILGAPGRLTASLAFAASCAQLTRLAGWKPFATLQNPLLWILHVSYAWIAGGFFLLALAAAGLVSESAAFHALTVGATAGLIIGMITRTALGHTGRPLRAAGSELAMYLLVQFGAVARVMGSLDALGMKPMWLLVAAACWCAAFALYVAVYAPYLTRVRVDGKDG